MSGLERDQGRSASNPFLLRLQRSAAVAEADLAALNRLLDVRRHLRDRVELLAEGAQSDHVHILLDGWACRYKMLEDGRRHIATLLLPGDICDYDTLHVRRLDYAVATLAPCTVAVSDCATILALAAERPGVARALGWLGVVENTALTERNLGLGRRTALERVAHLLCELFLRLAAIGQVRQDGYALPLTQEDVADVLGLSTVHVNRMLAELRRDGLVTVRDRDVAVHDWAGLCAAAEFRPDYLHLGNSDGPDIPRVGYPPAAASKPSGSGGGRIKSYSPTGR